ETSHIIGRTVDDVGELTDDLPEVFPLTGQIGPVSHDSGVVGERPQVDTVRIRIRETVIRAIPEQVRQDVVLMLSTEIQVVTNQTVVEVPIYLRDPEG